MGDKQIDIVDLGISLSENDIFDLCEMFGTNGWKAFQKIKRIEEKAAIDSAMSLATDENTRAMQRAIYHKLLADQCFEGSIRVAAKVASGQMTAEDAWD